MCYIRTLNPWVINKPATWTTFILDNRLCIHMIAFQKRGHDVQEVIRTLWAYQQHEFGMILLSLLYGASGTMPFVPAWFVTLSHITFDQTHVAALFLCRFWELCHLNEAADIRASSPFILSRLYLHYFRRRVSRNLLYSFRTSFKYFWSSYRDEAWPWWLPHGLHPSVVFFLEIRLIASEPSTSAMHTSSIK